MADIRENVEGPSPRAVALARFWLIAMGYLWIVGGVAAAVTSNEWLALAAVAIGVVHILIAQFASRRVIVFFAIFGP